MIKLKSRRRRRTFVNGGSGGESHGTAKKSKEKQFSREVLGGILATRIKGGCQKSGLLL